MSSGWLAGGVKYSFYNLGIIPALLYTIRDTKTRKESVFQGLLDGIIAIIPAILLIIALEEGIPTTLEETVPVNDLFKLINMPWFFEIKLFGPLIETGTGFIKSVSDRVEHTYAVKNQSAPSYVRTVVVCSSVAIGIGVAQLGLTQFIAKGYGTICWKFFFIFVIPMLTIGIYKISKTRETRH